MASKVELPRGAEPPVYSNDTQQDNLHTASDQKVAICVGAVIKDTPKPQNSNAIANNRQIDEVIAKQCQNSEVHLQVLITWITIIRSYAQGEEKDENMPRSHAQDGAVPSVYWKDFRKALPRQDGKVFVITGTTSGTGFVAAKTVGELGATVLLLNRKSERSMKSLETLKREVPNGAFVQFECDLQDFASVRMACEEIEGRYKKIHCIANNAGIMGNKDLATKDGFDVQMQTNHLSHFLISSKLYPLVEAAAREDGEGRIVTHSSQGRHYAKGNRLRAEYFQKKGGNLGGDQMPVWGPGGARFERYFQTKLANAVFTQALHEKLQNKGVNVKAICCHPGVARTSLADDLFNQSHFGCLTAALFNRLAQSIEDGSMGLLKAMVVLDVESGTMHGPDGCLFGHVYGQAIQIKLKPHETSEEHKRMLWELSEAAVGTFRI